MSLKQNKSKSALGNNPLSDLSSSSSLGIFNRTDKIDNSQDSRFNNQDYNSQDSIINNQESRTFSLTNKDIEKEKTNLRIPIYINDWLDDLTKQSKRNHGHKIPKEIWIQAALELFKSLPIDWKEVDSIEELQKQIQFCSDKLS